MCASLVPHILFKAVCKRINIWSNIDLTHCGHQMKVIIKLQKVLYLFMRSQQVINFGCLRVVIALHLFPISFAVRLPESNSSEKLIFFLNLLKEFFDRCVSVDEKPSLTPLRQIDTDANCFKSVLDLHLACYRFISLMKMITADCHRRHFSCLFRAHRHASLLTLHVKRGMVEAVGEERSRRHSSSYKGICLLHLLFNEVNL